MQLYTVYSKCESELTTILDKIIMHIFIIAIHIKLKKKPDGNFQINIVQLSIGEKACSQ